MSCYEEKEWMQLPARMPSTQVSFSYLTSSSYVCFCADAFSACAWQFLRAFVFFRLA
jgi:hypothetical protein